MLENSEKSDNENSSDTKKIKVNRPVVATIEALDIRSQLSPVVLAPVATSSSGSTGSRGTISTEVTEISELNIVSVLQLSQEDDGGNGEEPTASAGRGETASAGRGETASVGRGETVPAVSTSSGATVASNSNGGSCGYFGYAIEDAKLPLCLIAKRHLEPIEGIVCETQSWRIRERMKTVSVALVLCLNIGVDPPDIVKIQPCARLECWIDPSSVSPQKAMELIGANLQKQYERWQPRARYKKFHDPTVEDVKKLCTSLRRNAKEERVLFHYNGHGVPRPTSNGEIWVFNKTYTQYIPLSIYDLQTWMGAPSIYVYDCSNAGIIVNSFNQFAEQHEREMEQNFSSGNRQSPSNVQMITYKNCIQLAACSANQILPMNAKLPADLFTSCLTTPIKIALKWYTMQRTAMLAPQINQDLIEKIPGQLNDRRTMLGELNWIFTAITDTIAWNTLPRDLFQKLFRQDLLVASLFRNFLLAERILRSYDCTPVSSPSLPQGSRHPMWSAWDLAVDLALLQLPDILEKGVPYKQLPFFEEQLTAFQVWLDRGTENRSPPEQLPIVLQVLLSQVHRLRALELLGRFLDLGPWAVNLALGVGIFPYVLKLLQSSAKELRPVLVFIWAKILAVDSTCQVDLVKDHKYFLSVLQDPTVSKKHRTLSAFVLASIVHNFLIGQTSALQGSLVSICLVQIYDESWLLRQWLTICLGQLWQNFAKARWSGVRDLAHEKLYTLLQDPVPEVRAAAVFALGTYISSVTERSEHANNIDRFIAMTLLTTVGDDMSPMVRLELVSALQWMIILFENQFVTVYLQDSIACTGHSAMSSSGHHTTHSLERNINMKRVFSSSSIPTMGAGGSFTTATSTIGFGSIYMKLWQGIMNLGRDPYPKVAEAAQTIIEYVRNQAVGMIAAKEAASEKYGSSLSLPPSPNTRTNYLGESPPTAVGPSAITHHHHNPLTYVINSAAVITAAVTVGHSGGHGGGGSKTSPSNQRIGANTSNNTRSTTPTQHYQQQQQVGCNCGPVGLGVGAAAGGTITGATASTRNRFTSSNMPTQPSKMRTISSHDDNESRSYTAATGQDINPHSHQQQQQQQHHHHHYHHHHHGQQQQQQQQQQPVAIQQTHQQQQQQPTKPLVTTNFIPWAISYFARSTSSSQPIARFDPHSPEFRSRQWRFVRNEYIRRISREQQQRAIFHRIDTQSWIGKTQSTPSIVKLLPYEQQIAVAYKEKVSVHDWARGTYYSFVQQQPTSHNFNTVLMGSGSLGGNNKKTINSPIAQTSRVTAMEFINAHDNVMILVGYEDGMIRIWQEPNRPNGDIRLVTAWQGLPSSTRISKDICGLVTTWHQKSQQLCVGGYTRFLRIWDAEKELKICDIPTGSDSSVRVLSSSPNELIAAGCSDGSVRLFDKRCPPSDARIMTYREHSGAIITACLRDNCESLVSGCSLGKIRLFDVRGQSSVQNWYVGNDVTSIAVHTGADIVACGSQYISIFGLDGRHQTSLRSHEGFMGTKISHTSCLSFHPHKVILAGGFVDNTVAVYVSSGNNRIT